MTHDLRLWGSSLRLDCHPVMVIGGGLTVYSVCIYVFVNCVCMCVCAPLQVLDAVSLEERFKKTLPLLSRQIEGLKLLHKTRKPRPDDDKKVG